MNLFSRSQNQGTKPDALRYDLPYELRIQIVYAWEKGFGPHDRFSAGPSMAYEKIYQTLCEEHQLPALPYVSRGEVTHRIAVAEYFLNLEDVSKALDVVEVVFNKMEELVHRFRNAWNDDIFVMAPRTEDTFNELNRRFKENNVGYQFVQGRIVKTPQDPAPMPLKERLVAGEPARNLRKIKDMIGELTVTAIHDPYTTTGSLETILKLADMGTKFSTSLRILGTARPLSNSTEKKSLLGLLRDINTERKASWEARIYPTTTKPHRRFIILQDGSIITCGMSLNHIDKDEVLDNEPCGSENAQHDRQLFEQKWKDAILI